MEKDSKKKVFFQIIIFIISFAVAFFVARYFLSGLSEKPNAMLLENSREANRSLPKMLDAETRLDSTSVKNDTIIFHHTLINTVKDSSALDFDLIKATMTQKAQNNLDTNPVMKDYRDNDVILHNTFIDQKQNKVFDYTVKYQNK